MKKPLDDKTTGMHRAKTWEIALYAMNDASTNCYMLLVNSISYFLVGIVGVLAVVAGTLITAMRIWDGCTDPFVGMAVDNTNTKFGKNRPYIVLGQIIMFVATFAMFNFIPELPSKSRFIVWLIIYMIYIVGYTCQCVVTKSAQSCLTNDPNQRPLFAMFTLIFNIFITAVFWPVFLSGTMLPGYTLTSDTAGEKIAELVSKNPSLANVVTTAESGIQTLSGYYNPEMWQQMQLVLGGISAILAVCAIIGLWRKDNPKYFGLGKAQKVSFRDYVDVLAHNRGIQMLIVAASSDKLALAVMGNSSVMISVYGIILGNFALYGSVSAITSVPVALLGAFGIATIATKLGQKKCLTVGTWGALISAGVLALLIIFGRNGGLAMPTFNILKLSTYGNLFTPSNWSFMGLLYIVAYIAMKGFSTLSGSIVVPMTADCADYEVYRSKRYVPGLMGTLFSFVDKVISSFGATLVTLVYAVIGYTNTLPTQEDPYSTGLLICTLICFLGFPCIGWILNVVAMKFYPLTKEKMVEIQDEIAAIKTSAEAQK